MSYKQNIEIEYISRGNNRAALDSVHEAIIRTSGEWPSYTDGRRFHPGKDYIKQLSKILLTMWARDIGEERAWHETYLKLCENIGPGEWRVIVIEPGLD